MRSPLPVLAALAASMLVAPALAAQQEIPRRLDFSSDTAVQPVRQESTRALRNAFVRNQTLLGLTVYGPSFGVMVGNDGLTGTAGYLVMAGRLVLRVGRVRAAPRDDRGRSSSSPRRWRGAPPDPRSGSPTRPTAKRKSSAAATLIGGLGGTVSGL